MQQFRYAIDLRLAPFWAPFGVRPAKDGVTLTDDGRFRATFGFLHVRHADPLGIRWRRVEMIDDGNGKFERSWVARFTGRDRFVVDAIDAATLALGTADNYRSNELGIPFRVE